jgi:hypothetical protein
VIALLVDTPNSIQKALSLNTTKIAQLEAENASLKRKVDALNQPKRKKIKPNPNQRFIEQQDILKAVDSQEPPPKSIIKFHNFQDLE